MLRFRTFYRIDRAISQAEKMELQGTAARLRILSKHLADADCESGKEKDDRMRWAVAKLDDTVRTLDRETDLAVKNGHSQDYEYTVKGLKKLAKTATLLGLVLVSSELAKCFAMPDCSIVRPYLLISAFASLALLLFKGIDRNIGSDTFAKGAERIREALLRCREEVQRGLASRQSE